MTVTKSVNLSVYKANLSQIIEEMKPARVMAVIKADGYGHGLIQTAKAAAEVGVEILGVLDIETGLVLRNAGLETPAFAWLHSPDSDFALAVSNGIELSAGSLAELESIAKASGRARVHLKLDTGLSRNGCRPEYWQDFVARAVDLEKTGAIDLVAIWSHLSNASLEEDEKSLQLFETASTQAKSLGFTGYRHVASSPAAFGNPTSRYDLVRIGVSAFGTSPIEGVSSESFGLQSPMSVTAEVLSPGMVSIGFLHGYFSQLSEKAKVAINGKLYRVIKVGHLASSIETGEYVIGDRVEVFGPEGALAPTAEALCELVNTVTDELFTGMKTNLTTYSD